MHMVSRLRRAPALLIGLAAAALVLGAGAAAAAPRVAPAAGIWTIQRTPNRSQDFNQLTAITTNSATDIILKPIRVRKFLTCCDSVRHRASMKAWAN